MSTAPALPALVPSPSGDVSIESVAAAMVFYSRDYVPGRDKFQPPAAASQIAEIYGAMIFHKARSCEVSSLTPALVLLLAAVPIMPLTDVKPLPDNTPWALTSYSPC